MAGGAESVPRRIGRYVLHGEIAAGGMATVHFGRLVGPAGFSRAVAIKRLHPQLARDPEFVAMFIDEARLAARIFHPNVVPTLDVVAIDAELFLVMEYVRGAPLSQLIRAARAHGTRIPPRVVAGIVCGMLQGLHAAHEARDELGERLDIVHRDVSPQNVLVDVDGVARVLDFGVAKAAGRAQTTRSGQLKGKLGYMAPEQLRGAGATRQSDVYGAAVVLWEALTGARLFRSDSDAAVYAKVLEGKIPPPSTLAPEVSPAVDEVVLRGAAVDPGGRYATACEMARDLEAAIPCAPSREIGEWVVAYVAEELSERAARIAEIERSSGSLPAVDPIASAPPEALTHAAAPLAQARARNRPAGARESVAIVLAGPDATMATPGGGRRRARALAALVIGLAVAGAVGAKGFEHPLTRVERAVVPGGVDASTSAASSLPAVVTTAAPPPMTGDASVAVEPTTGAKTTTASRPATAPHRAPSCDPPSTTDERGHVHFKPECF